jgi:hypothetical protein
VVSLPDGAAAEERPLDAFVERIIQARDREY